jgi:hypothetical protein
LKAETPRKNLKADDSVTADAARYLRIPGSFNFKLEQKRSCEIIYSKKIDNTVIRHSYDALAERLISREPPAVALINPREPATDENIAKVKSALKHISADCDYTRWLSILMAIHSTGWATAEDMAWRWSMTAPTRFDVDVFDRTWKSLKVDGATTVKTLFWTARKNGWIPPNGDRRNTAFVRNGRGAVTNIAANVHNILLEDPYFADAVRFNQFPATRELYRPLGEADKSGLNRYPIAWSDADTIAALAHIQKGGVIPGCTRNAADEALILLDSQVTYHPVRQYLESLKWDGIPRLDDWLANYLNADEGGHPEYLRFVGPAVLIQAVARIYSPGVKAYSVMVLEGKQGVGKSTSLRILASDPWFSDSLPRDLGSKDAYQHMRGCWILSCQN